MRDPLITRYPEWHCAACGHRLSAASCFMDPDARPAQGDWSVCINCGAPLEFVAGKWEARRDDQIPDELLVDMLKHRAILRKIHRE